MEWTLIFEKLLPPLIVGILAFWGGRAQAKKTNLDGAVLTLDKINELLDKLMAAKEEMINLKSQIAELGRASKELDEVKRRILAICEELEVDTTRAIAMLMSLKKRIES